MACGASGSCCLSWGFLSLTTAVSPTVSYCSQMRGEAEAFAIGARARAEAEQMAKKAEAFQLYREAAQLDMLLEKLPQVCGWWAPGEEQNQGVQGKG